jgi:hypothetical protein
MASLLFLRTPFFASVRNPDFQAIMSYQTLLRGTKNTVGPCTRTLERSIRFLDRLIRGISIPYRIAQGE